MYTRLFWAVLEFKFSPNQKSFCFLVCMFPNRLKCTSQTVPLMHALSIRAVHLDCHGPIKRYVNLRVAHAPGTPGTFSPIPRFSDPDMHHGTCVTHVPWCMPRSLTRGFLRSRWRGKCSRHSRRMRNSQFYVSGKRPMMWPISVCNR